MIAFPILLVAHLNRGNDNVDRTLVDYLSRGNDNVNRTTDDCSNYFGHSHDTHLSLIYKQHFFIFLKKKECEPIN